ncbi:MAG TPA: hypothetical protein VFX49_03760, partial [Chloroflexota bacterium]|nr:hypothetical protein [Chloroflexota bacterium]
RFEFGTTANGLGGVGSCVEMDDAVVAMEATAKQVNFGFVRNVSDSLIDAKLPRVLHAPWATITYKRCGLRTSYNGALATWAVIAG